MKIEYKNSKGTIVFSGGRSYGRNTCYIASVSGLGIAPVSVTATVFSGLAGAKTEVIRFSQRTVILSADIPKRNYDFDIFYGDMLRILSDKGELFVYSKRKKRRIEAFVSNISEGKSQGDFKRIVITFTCDSPYFTDFEKVNVSLLTINKHLETEFILPLVFSERVSRAVVTNSGDITAEPVITFKNGVDGAYDAGGYLVISNETTGQFVTLNYYPAPGETVTIDISNRTITSDSGANLINFISDETDLSEFRLALGENVVSAESNVTNNRVFVGCSFYNRYIEGVADGY